MSPFDPYRDWLGIEQDERPVDHYRLLGLARFEGDVERIARAADERMALVRGFQVGPRTAHTQKLLNELSAARGCLLSPAAKAEYDAGLARAVALPPPPLPEPPVHAPAPPPRLALGSHAAPPIAPPATPRKAPWWRPIAIMLAASLLVLASAAAWGVIQSRRATIAQLNSSNSAAADVPAPQPPAPEPVVQLQEANGEVNLSPATAVLAGGVEVRTAGTEELLAGFGSAQAAARWKFRLVEPGFFRLEIQYTTAADARPVVLVAVVDDESKECELRSSGSADQLLTDEFTLAIPRSGQHSLALRTASASERDALVLNSVRLVPVRAAAPVLEAP